MNQQKSFLVLKYISGGILIAGLFFFFGMKYGARTSRANLPSGMRQFQNANGMNARTRGMGDRRNFNGGMIFGEILSKDATSMTIKLPDGGSKIVFYTSSTPITKTVSGTNDDVLPGKTVVISGSPNSDGSVNAESIQFRSSPMGVMNVSR